MARWPFRRDTPGEPASKEEVERTNQAPLHADRPDGLSVPGRREMPDVLCEGETCLQEAEKVVDGKRREDYGHPKDNHRRTAEMWNAYLSCKKGQLDPYDICILNILQKASRLANRRTRDGLVDIAGYARNAEIVSSPPTPDSDGDRGGGSSESRDAVPGVGGGEG